MRQVRNEIGMLMRQIVNIESTTAIGTGKVGACWQVGTTLGDGRGNTPIVPSQLVSLQGLAAVFRGEAGVFPLRRSKTLGTGSVGRADGCCLTAPNPSLRPVVALQIVGLLMPRVEKVSQ